MENELYGYAIPEIKEFIGKREERPCFKVIPRELWTFCGD